MALSTIPFSGLGADASNQGVNFRNLIINGDMSIAQRGTSQTGVNTSAYGQWCDRWHYNGNSGTYTISQSTDVPTGQGFSKSLKMDCTTANASMGASEFAMMRTLLEAQNLQHLKYGTSNAESLTLSFWVKSNKTGTYCVWLYQDDDGRSISQSYTINSASTWEKKTVTFASDTTGVIDNDNDRGLRVNFYLGAGSNFTSGTLGTSWQSDVAGDRAVGQVNLADSTSNEWYITGVQLEVGTTASDFEFLPYDVNLQRCQRYYYYIGGTNATYKRIATVITNPNNRNQTAGLHALPVPMRGNPTVSLPSASNITGVYIGGADNYGSVTASGQSEWSGDKDVSLLRFSGTLQSNVGNHALQAEISYNSTYKLEADAEL